MNDELTTEDIDILIQALDAWIDSGLAGELVGDILSAALTKDGDPEQKAHFEGQREKARQKHKQTAEQRKRTATILKAKLYQIQATADADGIVRSLMP